MPRANVPDPHSSRWWRPYLRSAVRTFQNGFQLFVGLARSAHTLALPYLPNLKQWFGSLVVASLAWVTFFVSPLKDMIFDFIYPESLSIIAQPDLNTSEGSRFRVPVTVLARNFRGISPGVLSANADNAGGSDVIVISERTIAIDRTEGATATVYITGFARVTGRTTLHISYSNSKGASLVVASTSVDINVSNADGVVESNFSGGWNVRLLDDIGDMSVVDSRGKLVGQVSISSGPNQRHDYILQANRDGDSFFGNLWPESSSDSRIVIKGYWKPLKSSIVISGSCNFQSRKDGKWANTRTEADCFSADATSHQTIDLQSDAS